MSSSTVALAAKQLGALVAEEGSYLYDVRDKIERLQRDLQWMQCFLEDADNRQHKEKVVAIWVSEIRDFAYEAEEIVEEYLCRVTRHRKDGKCNTIKWFSCVLWDAQALHDVGSSIDSLRTRINETVSRMQIFGIQMTSLQSESVAYNIAMREQRRTYAHIEEDPVGLEEDIKEVVDKLVNENEVNVLGISGMGGLGKTTLARRVFHNADVRKYFKNNRVWVYISKQFERKDIYKEILFGLSNIGKDKEKPKRNKELPDSGFGIRSIKELPDGYLPREICRILKEKECLVVLDDLWENGDWDTLKPAFEGIKSSENKESVGSQDSTRENDTTEEIVTDDDVKAKEKLGRAMLKHCKGLPLAIKALGGLLSTKRTVVEWENVQRNIASYLMSDMVEGSDNKELSSVLELSYYDLPFYMKSCFMYLGIFPEDHKMSVQRLYHLWEAEGLVSTSVYGGDEITGIALDGIAELFLNQLVQRSMVQVEETWSNGRIKYCRLHDIMRDLCLKKCKEVNFLNIIEHGSLEGPSNQVVCLSAANRKLRRCAIYLRGPGSLLDTNRKDSPCIRSIVVFPQGHNEAGELLSGKTQEALSLIRVLDLEGTNIRGPWPVKIANFIHLRYLSIKGANTSGVPSGIWDCKYLETLDLRSFSKKMKLSNKFWKLERLRHLFLPSCPCNVSLRDSKELKLNPNQLQQMETFKNFNSRFCKTGDLEKMTNIRVFTVYTSFYDTGCYRKESLEGLLKSPFISAKRLVKPLRLPVDANVINEDPTILTTRVPDSCIGGLYILGEITVELDSRVQIFPRFLTTVKLERCKIGEEGIRMLEKLPRLKRLYLYILGTKVSKLSFSNGGFTQLIKLFLISLCELEEFVVEEGALQNLQFLRIVWCKRLKKIPEGLPSSAHIECREPCVKGIEFYNTCPHFRNSS